ncbi:MAG: hypothetical protein KBE37_12700 [Bacteroidia bacterium]|nr:hypothetical protein [Bacteroidia bacterium]
MVINVVGCGATANEFKGDWETVICVNDAPIVCCAAVVCVDRPERFSIIRRNKIRGHIAKDFFSQFTEWAAETIKIELKAIHAHNNRWNEFIPSSNNSPFVACGVAYKYFNATEIRLWGVDMLDHPHLNGAMREQSVKDFQLLQKILNEKGCRIIPHEKSYLFGKI